MNKPDYLGEFDRCFEKYLEKIREVEEREERKFFGLKEFDNAYIERMKKK